MRKLHFAVLLSATLLAQPVFADTGLTTEGDTKPCAEIAKACLDAGYSQENSTSRLFWKDCMKPVILGQKVEGINITTDTVKMCRADKIAKLKKELEEFKKAFEANK